ENYFYTTVKEVFVSEVKRIVEIEIIIISKLTSNTNKLIKLLNQSNMKVLTMEKEAHQLNSFIYRYNPDLILLDVSYIKKNHNTVQETIIKYNIPVIVLSSRSVHDTAKTVFAITNETSDFILIDQLDERNNQHEAIKKINYVVSSRPLKKQPKQVDEVNTSYKSQYSPKKTKELTNENNLPIS